MPRTWRITGGAASPRLYRLQEILGKKTVLERIDTALSKYCQVAKIDDNVP
ncbi:MAG: hypothetical protein ABSA83_03925 [Verrucomicrobiota bacterium]